MFERLTDRSRLAVNTYAQIAAHRTGSVNVEPVHLLAALTRDESAVSTQVLAKKGLTLDTLGQAIVTVLNCQLREENGSLNLPMSAEVLEIVDTRAPAVARSIKHNYVGTEHLLIALTMCQEPKLLNVWEILKVDPKELCGSVYDLLGVVPVMLSGDLGVAVREGQVGEKMLSALNNPVAAKAFDKAMGLTPEKP